MRNLRNTFGLILFSCLTFILSWSSGSAQMIADITEDVETEFGTYHPYIVEITPQANSYTIEAGFANVVNFADFSFSAVEESLLFRNAFTARPSGYMEIYDIYNECAELEIPIFVTTDALLHTYHLLYDRILRTAEERQFYDDLTMLTQVLLDNSDSLYHAAGDPTVKEALRLTVAYLSVAMALLDSSYLPSAYVEDLVVEECNLIEAHPGFSPSPIFGYSEDYSQYVPRGHYTRSDMLRSYFKAMMWFGRMAFVLKHESTRRALLLIYCFENTTVGDESAETVWDRIYRPTVFFVGRTDDLNIDQYRELMEEIYGESFASLTVDTFANDSLLEQFILSAEELPDPGIVTTTPKGFRFMGQRFIPDSYILSQLTQIIGRPMPKGLDVMSVLGSERAYQILDEVYHQPDMYQGYEAKMDSLKVKFAAFPDATWAQNLYYNWLYSLMPLLFAKAEGYPTFMRNQAWTDKEIYTSLGSWTELRHDTILYAKQSVSYGEFSEFVFNCYVEPNPYLFARLASLTNLMEQGLNELGLLFDDFGGRLSDLEILLLCLKVMAEKELLNQPLSSEEYVLLANIGVILESLVDFDSPYPSLLTDGPVSDDQMALVADVHTDAMVTFTCLEEGVGYPFNLYVIVEIDGELKVTRGAGFSYFEFAQAISDRLTDEAWQQILQTDPPDPPGWVASFIDLDQNFTIPSPTHYFFSTQHEIPDVDTTGLIEDHSPGSRLPLSPRISQNYPNPFNPVTEIRYQIPAIGDQITSNVNLSLYNVLGKMVRTLVDGKQSPGYYKVIWDGRDKNGNPVASGIYFCRLKVGEFTKARRMVLIR